jgi:signal transduction histidine kinase
MSAAQMRAELNSMCDLDHILCIHCGRIIRLRCDVGHFLVPKSFVIGGCCGHRKGQRMGRRTNRPGGRALVWTSGIWTLPVCAGVLWMLNASRTAYIATGIIGLLLAPLPALLWMNHENRSMAAGASKAEEESAQLRAELETVKYRTSRLREELRAADRQARLSHQLTLLGQFTAGFLHEFNNPLAIVVGRIEVLLEERNEDAALCADLEQMLKEARYMGKIATTLLQALRRERSREVFDACIPQKPMSEAIAAIRSRAEHQQVTIIEEIADAPRVDVPEHVIGEVVRALLCNALEALKDKSEGRVWARLMPYWAAGANVVVRVEDNGPGVPENIRSHLFEPFVSQSSGRERLGLGLFLAASLLDIYDGRIHYETRDGGGASFIIELPPTRFTGGQPYHWFAGEATE